MEWSFFENKFCGERLSGPVGDSSHGFVHVSSFHAIWSATLFHWFSSPVRTPHLHVSPGVVIGCPQFLLYKILLPMFVSCSTTFLTEGAVQALNVPQTLRTPCTFSVIWLLFQSCLLMGCWPGFARSPYFLVDFSNNIIPFCTIYVIAVFCCSDKCRCLFEQCLYCALQNSNFFAQWDYAHLKANDSMHLFGGQTCMKGKKRLWRNVALWPQHTSGVANTHMYPHSTALLDLLLPQCNWLQADGAGVDRTGFELACNWETFLTRTTHNGIISPAYFLTENFSMLRQMIVNRL